MEFTTKKIFVDIDTIIDYVEDEIEHYLDNYLDNSDLDAIDYNEVVIAVGHRLIEKRGNENEFGIKEIVKE